MTHLCITVRWLDDRYHGLVHREGPPEWPPSPYRLFQALVAGAARRGKFDDEIGKSLEWLQAKERKPPIIIAPRSRPGQIITRFVPNNDGDKKPTRPDRLTAKTLYPTLMLDRPEVHYLWPIDGTCPHEQLIEASRCLSCLGWGIDMAYADARLLDEGRIGLLRGVRWCPKPGVFRDDGLLRVPKEGTMADLRRAHASALNRIEHGNPLGIVDKPGIFDSVFYSSAERPIGRPAAVFALRTTRDEAFSYPHAKLMHIAGMTRCAAIKAMDPVGGYPPESIRDAVTWVDSFVAGHRPEGVETHERFSYVPLPSVGHEHADAMIRRVMIIAPFGHDDELVHLVDQLDGMHLERENGGEGPVLSRMRPDGVTRCYLGPSRIWATVTPVILPGHDDQKPAKTVKLIERALRQSGVEQTCKFTWSSVPNFPHCLTANRYDQKNRRVGYFRPDHLQSLTAVHLRLAFDHSFAGPLCIGSGRHCGLGVLAVPLQSDEQ
jgi:CRISPR-associated protein Csb2